jgi:tetrahydromethanopterin S-methyltransferase subunit B
MPDIEIPDETKEEYTDRNGVLSYAGEWHALFYGVLVGLTGQEALIVAFVSYLVGRNKLPERFPTTEHLRDAGREPAYSGFGVLAGLALHAFAFGKSIAALLPSLPL